MKGPWMDSNKLRDLAEKRVSGIENSDFYEYIHAAADTIDYLEGPKNYESLAEVQRLAMNQAAAGKGKMRHASDGEPFDKQPICEITRRLGPGYPLGQAVKKIYESRRLDRDAAVAELLGAMNYVCAAVIVEMEKN